MQRILVTGSSGFIGNYLIKELINQGFEIGCCDLKINQTFLDYNFTELKVYEGNIMNFSFVKNCIEDFRPNYIFHLAGLKNRENNFYEFEDLFKINFIGTLNIYNSLIESKDLNLIVSMGTIDEYGDTDSPYIENSIERPNSAYGLSKLNVTKLSSIYAKKYDLPTLVLRPSVVYGPGQGNEMFIPALISSLLNSKEFNMTKGEQLRDFLFIDDLISAILFCIYNYKSKGDVINISSGKSYKLYDVAGRIAAKLGKNNLLKIGAIPYRTNEVMDYSVCIKKAKNLIKWEPKVTLDDGIDKTISYYLDKFGN